MERLDPREQVKVWNRARPTQQPVTEGLQSLVVAALSAAALYARLAKQMNGVQKERVLLLRDEQLGIAHCLKGIHRMAGGAPMRLGDGTTSMQTAEATLRKNYGQSLKTLHAFENRSADEEYGAVFEALAVRQREHLRKITELMGLL